MIRNILDILSKKAIVNNTASLIQGYKFAPTFGVRTKFDVIAVMSAGCIMELGTHHDLINKHNGHYARLAKL